MIVMKARTLIVLIFALTIVGTQDFTSQSDPNQDVFDGVLVLTIIAVLSNLASLYESVYTRLGPQDNTLTDIYEIVQRLENATTEMAKAQHRTNEEYILRSLHDMNATSMNRSGRTKRSDVQSRFQTVLWLQKARDLDGNVLSLMKGLLGQFITGTDLMESINKNVKV